MYIYIYIYVHTFIHNIHIYIYTTYTYTYNYIDIHRSIYVFFRLLQNINRDGSVIQFPGYAIAVGYM